MVYEVIPNDLRDIRTKEARCTQVAFAKALGIGEDAVKKLEKGTQLPSLRLLAKMMALYGVRFDLNLDHPHPLLKAQLEADPEA